MNLVNYIFITVGLAVMAFFATFYVTSLVEKKLRAAIVSILFFGLFGIIWSLVFMAFWQDSMILLLPVAVVAVFTALFFLPAGGMSSIRIEDVNGKVDERDIMFAREEYLPGSEKYAIYYEMRPEHKKIDDRIRKLPVMFKPGGRHYDPVRSQQIEAIFEKIETALTYVDGPVADIRAEYNSEEATRIVKKYVLENGADDVGICELNPLYVYSHVGRGPEPWGQPIVNRHSYAIMFTLEMNYFHVESAPDLPITAETAAKYFEGARISIGLADYIRKLGYPARAHIAGSNYQIMLPPVAYDAGLGELGRHGYLISPTLGSRIRLGAVTTDLPLLTDKPITFGVQDFCQVCKKCATNCPSRAIPDGDKCEVRGVEKWLLDMEKCLWYWRVAGTDCGLCMKVCPFSHPPTPLHNLVKKAIKRSPFARRVAVYGDDLFYGRKKDF